MGFESVNLPASVICSLFGNSLVIIEPDGRENLKKSTPSELAASPKGPLKFLGNNLRKVCILVNYSNEAFLPDLQLQFLTKILGACKLNLGDVALVNIGKIAVGFDQIRNELHPEVTLLFAVDPSEIGLPIQFPDFKPQSFNGCNFLKSPAADSMNIETSDAKNQKMQLWNCLKQIFHL